MSPLAGVAPDVLEETRGACAWLHGIALNAETLGTAPEGVADWLALLGVACAAQLQALGQFPKGGLQ
ncbi:MAG: hypothetical protein ACREVW_10740 [Burkholderiales bacterium]